ncbi:D-hexose-6-phosphate mutarotase [Thalassotalea euphylliae]|uniref:Putative glucose-6-phosphate 1-epimerase n=1 Tax=Thalassotalea euphylliae TaxID=1655234 RepID=A0A3E0UF06_9GAMM|nr:D-hexose-6-phosphate mutarotase [Thalassotalea euphylliae]REL35163.1 D-hexose-6-phosphate mutarotase [Thalassotalea euphylliae]
MTLIGENNFGRIKQEGLGESLAQLVIEHQSCRARVSLYGGQVLAWRPSGQEEVFWLSNSSDYSQGKAIRGGIPLCWPWFGAHPNAEGAGNHGFARNVVWQLSSSEITEAGVELELVWQGENQHPQWPFKTKVVQKLVLGETFTQQLTIENQSPDTIEFTGALHSYFAVSNPAQVTIPNLDNVPFDCKLSEQKGQQDSLENSVGPLDRIYYSDQPMKIIDAGKQRVINLMPNQVNNWVLWNPGQKTAAGMADVHAGGEQEYVCLEAANIQPLTIASGESVTFGQVISLAKLS